MAWTKVYLRTKWHLDPSSRLATTKVVKLPVIYVGGKLPVSYRPLPARMGHLALVLKGVGHCHYYTVNIS